MQAIEGADSTALETKTTSIENQAENATQSPVMAKKDEENAIADTEVKVKVPNTPLSPSKETKENVESPSKAQEKPATEVTKSETASCRKEQPSIFVVETHHETEEVVERLLNVKGLEQSVSGLWGWMSGSVSKVAEKANQVAAEASKVAEKASQQASVVAEKASQQATIVAEKAAQAKILAEQQAKELAASMSKTMEDKASAEGKPAAPASSSLPWETAHPDRRAEARERILKLSMDDHTFTVPPPKEANYVYDAVQREPYAARMLDTDALLSAKRFKLVPKMVEEQEFWRNYFYRVDLILSALGLPSTPAALEANQTPKKESAAAEKAADLSKNRDLEEEMLKEIARAEASHMEDGMKEDENFDMLEDDLEFEDDPELEKSLNDLKL